MSMSIRTCLGSLFLVAVVLPFTHALDETNDAVDESCLLQSQSNLKRLRSRHTKDDSAILAGHSHRSQHYRQILHNFADVQYVADFHVGDQNLTGVLDTGSYEVLVFSKTCIGCGLGGVYQKFHSSQYSRGKWISTHSFGSGSAVSRLAKDSMSFGPLAVQKQYFWEVFQARMPVIETGNFNAIIGVGPQGTPMMEAEEDVNFSVALAANFIEDGKEIPQRLAEEVDTSKQFVEDMSKEMPLLDNLNSSDFSICLGEQPNSPGWFIWNDPAPSAFAKAFVSVPVIAKRSWGAMMKNVAVGDSTIGCESGCGAIFDSGTSLLAAPPKIYERLTREFQAWLAQNDCSKINQLPSLTFEVNGLTFSLPPHSYVGEVEGSVSNRLSSFLPNHTSKTTTCRLLLMQMATESQMGPMWILGMPFFRQYYTTFHRAVAPGRKMYFARASEDCIVDPSLPFHADNAPPPSLRKINLAKINVPRWLETMALKSYTIV